MGLLEGKTAMVTGTGAGIGFAATGRSSSVTESSPYVDGGRNQI